MKYKYFIYNINGTLLYESMCSYKEPLALKLAEKHCLISQLNGNKGAYSKLMPEGIAV